MKGEIETYEKTHLPGFLLVCAPCRNVILTIKMKGLQHKRNDVSEAGNNLNCVFDLFEIDEFSPGIHYFSLQIICQSLQRKHDKQGRRIFLNYKYCNV